MAIRQYKNGQIRFQVVNEDIRIEKKERPSWCG